MINETFDNIVGLGGVCRTAHQIRRYFGVEKAQVFDWFELPTESLVSVLENNFSDFCKTENMSVVRNGKAVMCSKYGIAHLHDFDQAKVNGNHDELIIPDLIAEVNKGNQERFNFLINRFRSLQGNILFVRQGDGINVDYNHNTPMTAQLLDRLISALNNYFPQQTFKLLLLDGSETLDISKYSNQVFKDNVETYGCLTWEGNDKGYDEIFSKYGILLAHNS